MGIRKQKILLCLLLTIQFFLVAGYIYYHKYYWSQDVLRVVYLEPGRDGAGLSPYGPGLDRELADHFSAWSGLKSTWMTADSFQEAVSMVQSGRAHLFIPGPHEVTLEWEDTSRGPQYMSSRLIIAHNQWRYPLRSMDDLCDAEVVVPHSPVFSDKISRLEQDLECSIDLSLVQSSGREFFSLLSSRDFRFGLVDELSFNLWHGFFPEVHKTYDFDTDYGHAWIWNNRFQDIDRLLTGFWEDTARDSLLLDLLDKYFGFFPPEKDPYQIRHFIRALEDRLPLYMEPIIEAAQEYNIDPLLLTALIYQESHFDPQARSKTGVRGLLQITMDTADFLGVQDRLDPGESILGGAKYLNFLMEHVQETGAGSWDKWFFTLAAYNQGLGHLYDAMTLARRKEKNHLSWAQVKEVYPLLSYKRYFETLPRGYARGFEAVNFVDNIRYYYYLLYSMISLSRPEVEHLSGLPDLAPVDWPD
jgi:membrane-bound lytic murein transglycosylase F